MKKQFITGLIILMAVSLTGIILVQYFWIKNAIEVKEAQFDNNVNDALSNVVKQVQTDEDVYYISNKVWVSSKEESDNYFSTYDTSKIPKSKILITKSNNDTYLIDDEDKITSISIDEDDEAIITIGELENENIRLQTIVKLDSLKKEIHSDQQIILTKFQDSIDLIVEKKISELSIESQNLNEVIEKMVVEIQNLDEPIENKIDPERIHKHIEQSLSDKGIKLAFEYSIHDKNSDSILSLHSENFNRDDIPSSYKIQLFPDNVLNRSGILYISFPDKNVHIVKSLALLMSGSLIFTFVILIIFFLAIRIILKQKKLSEIKSDFINNITHEFKTPIATISLAVDSIKNQKVFNDPNKIIYFSNVIEEENKRMNSRVENILQMSLIDNSDFNFRLEEVNVHSLINQIKKNFEFPVKSREGKIHLNLNAEQGVLLTDKSHLLNIITNLVDNAIKYSTDCPEVTISTKSDEKYFLIAVKDKGIGMTKEEQKKVFDKFYRVSKGDIHNVKGFGLGLSYVKAIILALKGNIEIHSEPVKGSEFIISFPV